MYCRAVVCCFIIVCIKLILTYSGSFITRHVLWKLFWASFEAIIYILLINNLFIYTFPPCPWRVIQAMETNLIDPVHLYYLECYWLITVIFSMYLSLLHNRNSSQFPTKHGYEILCHLFFLLAHKLMYHQL